MDEIAGPRRVHPINTDPSPGKPVRSQEPLWRDMVGDRLRSFRHERGETLADVATRAGISVQYLSEIERGRKEPSSEMIAAVVGALDLTLNDLTLAVAESLTQSHAAASRSVMCRAQFALAA